MLPVLQTPAVTFCHWIDEDYRGIVGVILFNHSDVEFKGRRVKIRTQNSRAACCPWAACSCLTVSRGDRIAQLILEKIATPDVVEVSTLPDSVRLGAGLRARGVCHGVQVPTALGWFGLAGEKAGLAPRASRLRL